MLTNPQIFKNQIKLQVTTRELVIEKTQHEFCSNSQMMTLNTSLVLPLIVITERMKHKPHFTCKQRISNRAQGIVQCES